jgi:hypothetical protein
MTLQTPRRFKPAAVLGDLILGRAELRTMNVKAIGVVAALLATVLACESVQALDLTCNVPPPDMNPNSVTGLRITATDRGDNYFEGLHPVFTLNSGEQRDRSVQYVKGWRIETVRDKAGNPALMRQGYFAGNPGHPVNNGHHVNAFITNLNSQRPTYREDHYTKEGVKEQVNSFNCYYTQQIVTEDHPRHPNVVDQDDVELDKHADQSQHRYDRAQDDGLPDCNDAEVFRVAAKVLSTSIFGHVDESMTKVVLPGTAHPYGIDRNSGAKFCQVDLRADEQEAHRIENGMLGPHPLSQLAYSINQQDAAGNPMVLKFKLQLSGEGRWVVYPVQ